MSAGIAGRLEGRVAIVTGAAQGIGKGIAEVFAAEGAAVVLVDVNRTLVVETAREVGDRLGATMHAVEADVTSREAIRSLIVEVEGRFGGVDILCHNAGISPMASIEEMTEDEWDIVLDTNLKSVLFLTKACLPSMKKKGHGRIVVTSSITGPVTAFPNLTHYGASKAGLLGFVRVAAVELAPFRITVNAVLPGNVLTPRVESLGKSYIDAQVARIPLGRMGRPDDIANAMLFFASDSAEYVTGQGLIVDGGQTLPEA